MNDEYAEKSLEYEQAGGIENVVNQVKRQLHQPFMVDPGLAFGGIGKRIGRVYPTLLPDVLPKTDMTPQIRVSRDIGKLGERERVHQDADQYIEAIPVRFSCV